MKTKKMWIGGASVLVAIALGIGSWYAYAFFTKKAFLEDYGAMNNYYKQALFFTGQGKRDESVANYTQLVASYASFRTTYHAYHPPVIMNDAQFNSDLDRIAELIAASEDTIVSGDLAAAHIELEQIRPMLQQILKRNNVSLLAVALVDFHDAMEIIIAAADAQDAAQVIAVYPDVSEKLHAVEETENDADIQAIRHDLDALLQLAQEGRVDALSHQAATLKSSFVKVYLTRG